MSQTEPNLGQGGHGNYRLLRTVLSGHVRRLEKDLADPCAAQNRRFLAIIKGLKGTQFALEHGLERIPSLSEYRSAVPIRKAADYRGYLERVALGERRVLTRQKPSMLLETSGTTGQPKHLPVTGAWAESVQLAQRLWTLALVRDHEDLADGKALTMVSPAVHALSPGGIPIGSNTGRIRAAQPFWLRGRYAVPTEAMDIPDALARQYAVLRYGLAADVRSITTANPSLVLLLFRRIEEWERELRTDIANGTLREGPASSIPDQLRQRLERKMKPSAARPSLDPIEAWNLVSVNCWTNGPAEFFADRLRARLNGVPVRELGVSASEGSIAFPLAADWPGSVLWVGGHLLEFVLPNGDVLMAHEREEGMRARVVLTTSAGLYRYDMEDDVEVVGRCVNTPMVRFLGKSGRYLNAVGERVTEQHVSAAMAAIDHAIDGFTARVRVGETPVYTIAFEGHCDEGQLAEQFDRALRKQNVEYDSKRASGRIAPPQGVRLSSGHYGRLRASRVQAGASPGQIKDPIIAIDDMEWRRVLEVES